jgi:hypothetical protein
VEPPEGSAPRPVPCGQSIAHCGRRVETWRATKPASRRWRAEERPRAPSRVVFEYNLRRNWLSEGLDNFYGFFDGALHHRWMR